MLKLIALLVFMLPVLPISTFAIQSPQITNVYNRNTVSLNGKWKYIIDQAEIGEKRKFWQDRQAKNKTALLEYNFKTASKINVPGDWNSQIDELLYYEGKVWYQKSFSFKKQEGKRYFLYFGAANYKSNVYLNGEKLGNHEGGFNPFNFEITDVLKSTNSLVVSVDNTRKKEQIPTVISDWKNFGGITRDVMIVEENETFIQDYYLQLKQGSKNELEFKVWLNGSDKNNKVEVNIPGLDLNKTVKAINGYAEAVFKVEVPEFWSPENPKLYEVVLGLKGTPLVDKIGFRTIEVKGQDILLNGSPVFLKGISLHEESPFTHGRAHSAEEAHMMLNWAKELGCNYVRLSHYPHSEHIVRLADKMGLLLWEEIPVYWDIDWENPKTIQLSKNMLNDMITRDKNRAATIIWSIANETHISDSRNHFLKTLIDFTRKKDNVRLISAALLVHGDGSTKNVRVVDDPFGKYVDVISVNQYTGWYGGSPDFLDEISWDIKFNKPFLFSEFGAGALGGFHADKLTRWSEEYQEWYYEKTLEMCKRINQLKGISPWILIDFQSPRRTLPHFQDGYNRKGLISSEGQKKKAFYTLQKYYLNKS